MPNKSMEQRDKKEKLLKIDRVKSLLEYDSKTGLFINIVCRTGTSGVGEEAGGLNHDGYVRITIDGYTYKAHRLAWFYKYGYFPENELDHKDKVRHHNWIDNLRESTKSCNMLNRKLSNSTTGVIGVSWDKEKKRFKAYIKGKTLGYYKVKYHAVLKRWRAEGPCSFKSTSYRWLSERGLI